jgi:hypothetical protein
VILSFRATGWSLGLTGCPEVAAGLEAILHGWGIERADRGTPDAEIARGADGQGDAFVWSSAARPKPHLWDKRPPETAMSVVTDIHDVFIDWFLDDHPDLLCLHAAAVEMSEGLVVFPSIGKSGKSTLTIALTARGHRFFCDDVLPVDPVSLEGQGLGIAPLLRKPIPETAGVADFVADRAGPGNERWTYVGLRADEMAPFGERKPIASLVLLERQEGASSSLAPLGKAEMLKEAILQNFGARGAPAMVLDSLTRLIAAKECYRLVYADVAQAADLLEERFA